MDKRKEKLIFYMMHEKRSLLFVALNILFFLIFKGKKS